MQKERILAYQMSEIISDEDLQDVAAAGATGTGTGSTHHADADVDYKL